MTWRLPNKHAVDSELETLPYVGPRPPTLVHAARTGPGTASRRQQRRSFRFRSTERIGVRHRASRRQWHNPHQPGPRCADRRRHRTNSVARGWREPDQHRGYGSARQRSARRCRRPCYLGRRDERHPPSRDAPFAFRQAAWLWRVEATNARDIAVPIDAILVQDLGLGVRAFITNNEAYASQYIDHHIARHARFGPVIMSRQNLAQDGKHPWVDPWLSRRRERVRDRRDAGVRSESSRLRRCRSRVRNAPCRSATAA